MGLRGNQIINMLINSSYYEAKKQYADNNEPY